MSPQQQLFDGHVPEPDLIDRIAEALPEKVRADYYRELSHCRVLPESDEMLRILRAMQFLTLLIAEVPGHMALEREKLGELLASSLKTIQATHQAGLAYQKQLEERLAQLPEEIAQGIQPETIAEKINESLRQKFARTGIPETGEALEAASKKMKLAAADFDKTSKQLTDRYTGLAPKVEQETDRIIQATGRLREATAQLARQTRTELTWGWVFVVLAIALGGFVGGVAWEKGNTSSAIAYLQQQVEQLQQKIVSQQATPAAAKRTKKQ